MTLSMTTGDLTLTYRDRIEALRETKRKQTEEKKALIGYMDHDDWAVVLPPPDKREIVERMGASGEPIRDVVLKGFKPESNHSNGGFYGPEIAGKNFRKLLEMHPAYIDPMSSLAGAYMVNFFSYRQSHWKPELSYEHLKPQHERYRIRPGIGGVQHFCQDLTIGLKLGWTGILEKIQHYRTDNNGESKELYNGLEHVVRGMQSWIRRNAEAAAVAAENEESSFLRANLELRDNLEEMAAINGRLVSAPPRTFREACQWILWYQMAARMYNGSGSLGNLDQLLFPYYERDSRTGDLSDEEAVFHIACLLLRDTAYIQLGGYDRNGRDATNAVSLLVLDAADQLKIPANIGVAVGKGIDSGLLRRGVEMMLANRNGIPKFLGIDNTIDGFARNGYPLSAARQRAYSGCHWSAIPGREYTVNDLVKLHLGVIFDIALQENLAEANPCTKRLWSRFEMHLRTAIDVIARGLDFHMKHMHEVFPELVLDLLCHGPIEKGRDASNGGLEYYNLGIDIAALGTVADSFAALEQRIEIEKKLSWDEITRHLNNNWAGAAGEKARSMMAGSPRYGSGDSLGDSYARRISELFTQIVKERSTPDGFNLIPGIFSWALVVAMGKELRATPNGRYAGEPISQGANPHASPQSTQPTSMARTIASVQPGFGNTAPMQIDLDPGLASDEQGVEIIESLIKTHFELGGTQINMNVIDTSKILKAHKDPSRYPDLVVRVTGFSAYFGTLSEELRQYVVDRIVALQ
jgi:formate C-acetyltransferase